MTVLKRLLAPPIFNDEAKSQQAFMLHVMAWAGLPVSFIFGVYALFFMQAYQERSLWQAGIAIVVNVFLLILLHRGYLRFVSLFQVGFFWLFFTVSAWTGSGVYGEAYLLGYAVVIGVAGILLGGTGATIFTVLSLASGLLMVSGQQLGLRFEPVNATPPLTKWVITLVLFPFSAVLQYLGGRALRTALARARASEERYRLISEMISDYTFSTKLQPNGELQLDWVAGAFESITGYAYEEYIASGGWREHLHPDDVEKDIQDMATLGTNRSVVSEIRTYSKNRELRWVRVYANPVWDAAQNKLVGIVGAVQNITEKKLAEQEREALIAELERRNAELERFTYSVSHDLKSPLITISGFLSFLEKDALAGDVENVRLSIKRISQAAQKMRSLLEDLLELSRIGRLINPPEKVPFAEIVQEAVETMQAELNGSQIVIQIQGDFPVVYGDRVRLVEVLHNLLDNAIKFSKKDERPAIEIGTRGCDEHGRSVFFLRDRGIGIPAQFHERIFGLFNKLDAQSDGAGVGLTLTKRIIEVHGGRIWLESRENEGTTFYFALAGPPD